MTSALIIGNACSLFAMFADVFSASRKTAKGILLAQALGQVIYCAGALLLKGYSAAVQNAVSVVRNLFAIRGKSCKAVEWLLIALGVILGAYFNNRGVLGWLPIIANLEYSLAVFRLQDNEWALKVCFFICVVLYTLFCFVILNFVGVITNSIVLFSTAVFLIKERKNRRVETDVDA